MKRLAPMIPQLLTFGTLVTGMISVVLSIEGYMMWAGIAILFGVLTDSLDGKVARATNTGSEFGLQLDSLADIVCFGVGASIFTYQFLRQSQISSLVSLLVTIPVPLAGVFRLARFNVQPAKSGRETYTTGLAITSAGAILASMGLSRLRYGSQLIPDWAFVLLPLGLAVLMASRMRFPTIGAITRRKKTTAVVLGVGTLLSIPLSPQVVTLGILLSYVGFGVARAGVGLAKG